MQLGWRRRDFGPIWLLDSSNSYTAGVRWQPDVKHTMNSQHNTMKVLAQKRKKKKKNNIGKNRAKVYPVVLSLLYVL